MGIVCRPIVRLSAIEQMISARVCGVVAELRLHDAVYFSRLLV